MSQIFLKFEVINKFRQKYYLDSMAYLPILYSPVCLLVRPCLTSRKQVRVTKTPITPHFYIVKLGYTGVYIFFLFLLQNIDVHPQSMF